MQMLGVVVNYNKEEKFGYIKAGDDTLYLFFSSQVANFDSLKIGNLVKFIPILDGNYAQNIEIIDNII